MRLYKDIETGETVSEAELLKLWKADETLQSEYPNFNAYIRCCQTSEGGTLEAM